ncbi:uncharacterized protein BYT42DRAFT_576167 [Radiomyces spectabilis]|uniref:uncharacterized protein n=1 Tax=Radiomyces spectabilis TaxID=64574 RepID=UPI00221F906B|nr:uncharacterized protein BYT42DRAFT_576167 [Radiomyces spectabilis]KAI8374382.1 hypothetical protein BYT42DRAFT_576167 [Radiomyces spectabilis]
MPLDYSKWDNIELSDDSDIEVHPNVDKRSMIKWKREAIHRERAERKAKMEYIEKFIPQQTKNIAKLDELITVLKEKGVDALLAAVTEQRDLVKQQEMGKAVMPTLDGKGQFTLEEVFSKMVDQIKEGLERSSPEQVKTVLLERLEQTRQATQKTVDEGAKELERLKKEASKKWTSENMFHETHNRTIINKSENSEPSKPAAKGKQKEKVVETLNPGVQMKDLSLEDAGADADVGSDDDEAPPDTDPRAIEFSKLRGFEPSFKYISQHKDIVNEKTADAILLEAFNAELGGNSEYAKNCVLQARTLEYCLKLGRDGVSLFFTRMHDTNGQARRMLFTDVEDTYKLLKSRCKVLQEEQAQQGEETIQLQPMNEGSQLTVRIPDPSNEEEKGVFEVYQALPEKFRKALETGDIEEINKVLATMAVPDAEQVVQVCSEYGFLDVDGQVLDEPPQ